MAYGSSRKCARKVLIFLKSNLLSFRMLVLRPNSVYMPHQQHAVKWIGLKVFLIYIADWASCKLFCLKRKEAPKATLARLERVLSSGDEQGQSVAHQVRVYASFSSIDAHTAHKFGIALGYGQPMNLVQQGTASVC